MTKEEIIKQNCAWLLPITQAEFGLVAIALDKYAEQESIAFIRWYLDNTYYFDAVEKVFVAAWDGYKRLTERELYKEYLKSKTQTKP